MAIKLGELRKIVDGLEDQGCRIKPSTNGWMVFFPGGTGHVSIHATPSDRKATNALRAIIKRAGLKWPPDGTSAR